MLHILDVLAVHEAVEAQPPVRRRICELIMEGYELWEIAPFLGFSRGALWRHLRGIRRSFIRMGFVPERPWRRRDREKNLPPQVQ